MRLHNHDRYVAVDRHNPDLPQRVTDHDWRISGQFAISAIRNYTDKVKELCHGDYDKTPTCTLLLSQILPTAYKGDADHGIPPTEVTDTNRSTSHGGTVSETVWRKFREPAVHRRAREANPLVPKYKRANLGKRRPATGPSESLEEPSPKRTISGRASAARAQIEGESAYTTSTVGSVKLRQSLPLPLPKPNPTAPGQPSTVTHDDDPAPEPSAAATSSDSV